MLETKLAAAERELSRLGPLAEAAADRDATGDALAAVQAAGRAQRDARHSAWLTRALAVVAIAAQFLPHFHHL